MRLTAAVSVLAVVLASSGGCEGKQPPADQQRPTQVAQRSATADLPPPGEPVVGRKPPMPNPVAVPNPAGYKVETIASGLDTPWDIAFVSRSRAYVTERPGRVRLIQNGRLQAKPYAVIDVQETGEGGLMGIAVHPNYPNPRYVYVMYTYRSGGQLRNCISRFTDTGSGLTNERRILTGIRGASVHDGGALSFGPDGMLYAGTGDARNAESAQNISSLNGKVLRMTPDGKPAPGNPFPNSVVYAYGFRNVQGLAWNPASNDLWATDHGPTGEFGLSAKDSIFRVRKGGNHGWPRSLGVTNIKGVVPPVLHFPNDSVPPAGAAFYNSSLMPQLKGNFFFTTLADECLYRVVLSSGGINRIEKWWSRGTHSGVYGRVRAVAVGPDGALYVSTSNRSRGNPTGSDDRILRISPR